jgi:RNA polymerase primary sigma factor
MSDAFPGDESLLGRYFRDVGKHALLTAEQEIELATTIQTGKGRARERARQTLITANLRLAVSIARKYNRGRMPLSDLVQEANLGIMRAVETFDPARGLRFSTYASWWVRHAIQRALADKSRTVRLPCHVQDTLGRVNKARLALESKHGREPSPDELASALDMSVEKLEQITLSSASCASLDAPMSDDDGRSFVDFLADDDLPADISLEREQQQALAHELLSELTPYHQDILSARFGIAANEGDEREEQTLKEIGDKYNLSRERIRQLQEKALDELRALAAVG